MAQPFDWWHSALTTKAHARRLVPNKTGLESQQPSDPPSPALCVPVLRAAARCASYSKPGSLSDASACLDASRACTERAAHATALV